MAKLTIDQALQKGIEAHKAGRVQEADRYYTAILKANPKHPDANHNMGILAVGVGKVQEALPFFKIALEVDHTIAQFWLSYINALIKLDQVADARELFDQAKSKGARGDEFDQIEKQIGLSPSKNSNIQELSQEQMQNLIKLYTQGQYQQALNEATKLLIKFPYSIHLYNIVGATNKSLGKPDEAIEAFKKATSIKPDYAEAYSNMGSVLEEQGKIDEAIEAFNKALSIKPDNVEAYYNLGNALKRHGKLGEAIEAFNNATSIKPDYAQAYNNMGLALEGHGKLGEAIEAFKKATSIKPDYAQAHNNMGLALQDQGKLEEAIEVFNKAISIKPDYAQAFSNLGLVLKKQGKLEKAIEALNKAISIKPDFVEAYNNLGVILHDHGKLDEAIEAYTKSLSISPNYTEAWNNLYFSLQAIKLQIKSDQNINTLYPKDINSNYGKILLSMLDYRLHRSQENEGCYLDRALSFLSNPENTVIQNPRFDNGRSEQVHFSPDKMVALVLFGRSGTGLLHSLIDNHPEVSTLPSIYFSEYFDRSTWMKITSGGWDGMVDNFISIYDVFFDATSSVPVETKSRKLQYNIGVTEGMANVGKQRNEVLKVSKQIFRSELKSLLDFYADLDACAFFKLVHIAHDKALQDLNSKSLIFYHIHNPDTNAKLNFSRFHPNTKWLLMVREPIQSCESSIRMSFRERDYFGVVSRILTMLFELNSAIYRNSSIGLRLEDLKTKPRKIIPVLCDWMSIAEVESLYEMTAQGKKWWGDPSSPDYSKDGMEPFGKTSIERKTGSIFSENDQFILRTLFYPFSVRFGYAKENEQQFKNDLETMRPMLDSLFDFEKAIIENTEADPELFIKSGSYLYFRSGLIERWDTLNKFGTYPNMIMPLEI